MAFNPDISLNMLQRQAAERAFKQGTNLPPQMIPPQMMPPQQLPQMIGDSTGVSQMDPAFMAAVRQQVMGQGPEEQPEISQPQAAPEAPQESSTAALMSGAADASRVAAMAHGGAVRGYADGGANSLMPLQMTGDSMGMSQIDPALLAAGRQEMIGQMPEEPNEILQRQIARFAAKAMAYGGAVKGYADGEEVVSDNNITPLTGEIELLTKKLEDPNLSGFERTNAKYALQAAEIKFKNARELSSPKPTFGQSLKNLAPVKFFLKPSSIKENEKLVNETKEKKEKYIKDNPLPSEKTIIPPPPVAAAPGPALSVAAPIVPVVAPTVPPVVKAGADIDSVAYENALAEIQKNRPETSLETLKKLVSDRGSDKISSQDKNLAFLQASLGTMAAASQPGAKFLGSIGQGGLVGLESLQKAKELKSKEKESELETYATLAALEEKNKPGLTEFQKSMDAQAGKDAAEYIAKGGPTTTARNIKQLTDVEGILQNAIESGEGITGPIRGLLSDIPIIGPKFAEKTIKIDEMVKQVVQSDLRTILGGQFAAKEGEGVLLRAINKNLSEEENLRRVQLLISTMTEASKAKEAQTKHVMRFGTLQNYEGPSVDSYLLELEQKFDAQDKGKKSNSAPIGPGNYTYAPGKGLTRQ
jgi:hypothetical protein